MVDTKHMDLNELAEATRENLKSRGYGDRTVYMVNSVWRDLAQFLGNRSKLPFLPLYGLEYLHERIGYPECLQRKLTPDERDYIRAVRMLTSFQENGTIPDKLNTTQENWFAPINGFREAYVRHCDNVFRTQGTKRSRIAAADRFMQVMMVNRGISVSDISPKIISEYVAGLAEYSKATIEVHLRGMRQFFRFLCDAGETAQDFSASVPKLHARASIETQRRALEKHSLVMPPVTPSWVTNTDTLEWLKSLGKSFLCKEKQGRFLDLPRNLPRFFS